MSGLPSTTASITALMHLSSEVIGYIKGVGGSTKERTRLRERIRTCEYLLRKITDEVGDVEASGVLKSKVKSLEAPDGPLEQLRKPLNVVRGKLAPKSGKNDKGPKTWPFADQEVEKLVVEIERGGSLLDLGLDTDSEFTESLPDYRETPPQSQPQPQPQPQDQGEQGNRLNKVGKIVDTLDQSQPDQERQEILDWITPVNYSVQQSDVFNRHQKDTGKWLLEAKEFQHWVNEEKQTLFCPGNPGAGKTTLTSIIIDHLKQKFCKDDDVCIAYLYCNFKRHDEQKAEDLLASLLRQLSHAHLCIPESVKALYEQHCAKGTRLSFPQLAKALHSVARQFSRVFIVIDGLDECPISGASQEMLIDAMLSLQANTPTNFLATSRFIPHITQKFHGKPTLEIRASAEDMERYLTSHMNKLPSFVSLERNKILRDDIVSEIIKAADGRFLLGQLYLDTLAGKMSARSIRHTLESFHGRSDPYDAAYEDAMKRIECQLPDQRDMAKQVMLWITCTKRQLTILELQHAFAVGDGDSDFDMENVPVVQDMVSVCAGLVTVDEQSGIIRLVHYTTQEYLDRNWKAFFPKAHEEIVSKCVTYLLFDIFESGQCQTKEKLKARLQEYPFYSYAALNWGHHARETSEAGDSIIQFLESGSKRCASYQAILYHRGRMAVVEGKVSYRPHNLTREFFTQYFLEGAKMSAMHLAAYFGLEGAMLTLIGKGHTSEPGYGNKTPLSYAAEHGHGSVVNLLLQNFDAGSQSRQPRTLRPLLTFKDAYPLPPISLAAINGQSEAVKHLLHYGASPNTWVTFDEEADTVLQLCTALEFAANSGNEAIVEMLLKHGADTSPNDHSKRTAITCAAAEGHEKVVKHLLAHGVSPNPEDHGEAPLSLAAKNGHEAVVTLLLEQNIDPDIVDVDGQTPLSLAAKNGHDTIVNVLLQKGADPELKSNNGQTPLSLAAENGHEMVVKLLLQQNADPASVDEDGQTPLSWAKKNDHEAVTHLLSHLDERLKGLKINTDVRAREIKPKTPYGR